MAGSGDSGRMRFVGGWTFRGLPGPRLDFLGGSSCRRGPANWKRFIHTLEKVGGFGRSFYARERVLGIFSNYASPFAIFLTSIF